jgi:hypothetical protein
MRRRITLSLAAVALVAASVVGYASADAASPKPANGGQAAIPAAVHPDAVAASYPSPENSYVPVSPCRIADSRHGGGGLNGARGFYVTGTTGFAPQGGTSGGCGVPVGAAAVTLSITTTASSGPGYYNVYPTGSTPSKSSLGSFAAHQNITTGTPARLALGTGKVLTIKTSRATHVVLDVTGYYVAPMAGYVYSTGALVYTSGRVLSSTRTSLGRYTVTFDRDVSKCSFIATPYSENYIVAVGPGGGANADVFIHDQAGTITYFDDSFFIQAVC